MKGKKPGLHGKTVPATATQIEINSSLRLFLYATAAITGAAILIIEILGAKMLAPYVGTSHFVWTAQIAVTLIALSVGYYLGGSLVDKSTRLGHLYLCILGAAVYLSLVVVVTEPVAYWCLQFKLALGALLTSLVLFLVPLTLLGMTTPFLVRILASSLSAIGGEVGRLSAISTLGSVAGTIAIGYLLIPFMANSLIMLLIAGLLIGVSLGYFLVWGRKERLKGGVLAGLLIALAFGVSGVYRENSVYFPELVEIYRSNSNFGLLQVLDQKHEKGRLFLTDYFCQNGYDPAKKQSMYAFTYLLHALARAYTTEISDVLCIGMGVGIVPMQFAHEGARVDVVEINPAITQVAVRYFDLELDRLHLVIDDGRYFLNKTSRFYDVIILDAFLGDSSPSHLLTREAFNAVRTRLKPGGILVMNTFGELVSGHDFLTVSIGRTLESVFSQVRVHQAAGGVFFVASDRSSLTFANTYDLRQVHPAALEDVKKGLSQLSHLNRTRGLVLTDDYNPVEYYDAVNREFARRYYAMQMRAK